MTDTRRRDGVIPMRVQDISAVNICGDWFLWISNDARQCLLGKPNEDRKAIVEGSE